MPPKRAGLSPQESAAQFASTFKQAISNFNVFDYILTLWVRLTSSIGLTAAVVLLLFILHQLFLWVDQEPEVAFDRAALLLEIVEIIWDTLGVLANAVIDVTNAAIIPIWNAYTFYFIEPIVILVIEVFSVIFFQQHYEGVIDESGFPYSGLDCGSSLAAATWCGRYQAYEQALIQDESGFVNGSSIFLGLNTARRLSEISQVDEFVAPKFELDGVSNSLARVATLGIVALAPLADTLFSILDDVLIGAAAVIFDAVWLVLKGLLETFKLLVKSGLLTFAVGVGVDFLVIYYLYYQLPLFLAGIDFILCCVDFFFPSGWGEQLRCADTNCFTGPSAMSDLLIFTSVPVVLKQFGTILEVSLNSGTGRRFAGSFAYDAGAGVADLLQSFYPAAAIADCTACFKCKFPEVRFVWWIVASVFSIVSETSFNTFRGNVSEHCMDNGSYYIQACGPRTIDWNTITYNEWKGKYSAGWYEYDHDLIEGYAALLKKRSEEKGGCSDSSTFGCKEKRAADSWFLRWEDGSNPTVANYEEAAPFTFQVCRLMRESAGANETDIGPGFTWYNPETVEHLAGGYLYAQCKRWRHEAYGEVGRAIHDLGYEIAACATSPVTCKKEYEECVGGCSGVDTNSLNHEFHATLAKAELSTALLGEDGVVSANANCTVKHTQIYVDIFAGGDSFKQFAARMRVRSGMTAIDGAWCNNNPLSCATVQRTLERSPGLVFVNGEFRHRWSIVPPSPPPFPSPPPGLVYGPQPPTPSPPPISPPPYYRDAENCIPLPTLANFGFDATREAVVGAKTEDRAACLYVRRILDEMRQASHCFSAVSHPSPPPPPPTGVSSANDAIQFNRDRIYSGDRTYDGRLYNTPVSNDDEAAQQRAANALVEVQAQLTQLGEAQPILKSILSGAINELSEAAGGTGAVTGTPRYSTAGTGAGRRLMQRIEYAHTLEKVLSQHPVMAAVGIEGIPGLTQISCEALCEAVSRDVSTSASPVQEQACNAYAFRRDHPSSVTDLTGHCWLLINSGACKVEDFGTELYSRNIESEQVCNNIRPGNDAVMCIGLPASNPNTLVLSHADATAIAAQTPKYAAPGSGGLPLPRTTAEAMGAQLSF